VQRRAAAVKVFLPERADVLLAGLARGGDDEDFQGRFALPQRQADQPERAVVGQGSFAELDAAREGWCWGGQGALLGCGVANDEFTQATASRALRQEASRGR
jgi:hypothetical protein